MNTLKEWKAIQNHEEDKIIVKKKNYNNGPEKVLEIKTTHTRSGHMAMKLEDADDSSMDKRIMMLKKEKQKLTPDVVRKIHETTNHKQLGNMLYIFRNAGRKDAEVRHLVEEVIDTCELCQKNKKSLSKPKVAFNKATNFNYVVTLDLKEVGTKHVLWMVCAFSRLIKGIVLSSKAADEVVQGIHHGWCLQFGFPSQGFWADNGREFQNEKMESFSSQMGFSP